MIVFPFYQFIINYTILSSDCQCERLLLYVGTKCNKRVGDTYQTKQKSCFRAMDRSATINHDQKIKENLPHWEELENLRNRALGGAFHDFFSI